MDFEFVGVSQPDHLRAPAFADLVQFIGVAAVCTADDDHRIAFSRKFSRLSLTLFSSITNCFENLNCFFATLYNIFNNFFKFFFRTGRLGHDGNIFVLQRQNCRLVVAVDDDALTRAPTAYARHFGVLFFPDDDDGFSLRGLFLGNFLDVPHKGAGTVENFDPARSALRIDRLAHAVRTEDQRRPVGNFGHVCNRLDAPLRNLLCHFGIVDQLPQKIGILRQLLNRCHF